MIREATLTDVPSMVKLGHEALTLNPAPNMRISWDKLDNLARECVWRTGNFAWVSEINGEVVAAVSALVHEQMVYERMQASVVQFYTKKPGEGIKLIREFLRWARAQRRIKSIVFTLETSADPRIGKMLNRMGLAAEMPVYVEWR